MPTAPLPSHCPFLPRGDEVLEGVLVWCLPSGVATGSAICWRPGLPPPHTPLVALATGPLPPQGNQGFCRVHTLHSGDGAAKQGQLDQPSPGSQS